ncbi:hypothetical protein VINE108521_08455 [Vibrio neonatus]
MKVVEYVLMSGLVIGILCALFGTFTAHAGDIWGTVLAIK